MYIYIYIHLHPRIRHTGYKQIQRFQRENFSSKTAEVPIFSCDLYRVFPFPFHDQYSVQTTVHFLWQRSGRFILSHPPMASFISFYIYISLIVPSFRYHNLSPALSLSTHYMKYSRYGLRVTLEFCCIFRSPFLHQGRHLAESSGVTVKSSFFFNNFIRSSWHITSRTTVHAHPSLKVPLCFNFSHHLCMFP